MRHGLIPAVAVAVALASACSGSAEARAASPGSCRAVPEGLMVDTGAGARISVRTVGRGRPILFIPSLGRGSADFDAVAARLATQGFMSVLPQPRGIGGSSGPPPSTLFDLADDVASVTRALCAGPVDVVGHAFGNRVARAFATRHPEMVSKLALLAGGGEAPIPPKIMAALQGSYAQGLKPDPERLEDLQLAFFARGHDPSPWLTGWYPQAAAAQMVAVRSTPTSSWWTAGGAPLLLVQASEDPIAPMANAEALRRDIGPNLTLVVLRHASHAMLPEQPAAISLALARYFAPGPPSQRRLQREVDRLVEP